MKEITITKANDGQRIEKFVRHYLSEAPLGYIYKAFRKKYRDDIRPVEDVVVAALDQSKLEDYTLRRRRNQPNLAAIPNEQIYELIGVTRNNQVTLAATMLFSPYPQTTLLHNR